MINIKALKFPQLSTQYFYVLLYTSINLRDSIKPLTHTKEANIWIVYIYFHGNMKCD